MKKSTKRILIGSAVVLSGVALYIALNSGQKIEDVGEQPDPSGSDLEDLMTQNTEGTSPIQQGDVLYPAYEFANVRSSMEIDDGWFNNRVSKVYSPNAIGGVTSISQVGSYTWYGVEWIEEIVMNSGNVVEQTESGFVRADVVTKNV